MAPSPAPTATTTDPSAAQRRLLAKMGLAMPDGSFYIRNGAVGATDLDNAIRAVGRGEADGTSGSSIRLHIMKRAKALGLTDKIPDTWNADGSLKHDDANSTDDFLEHFGVKGMHWGVRHTRAELESKATEHEKKAAAHVAAVSKSLQEDDADLLKNGLKSAPFKRVYGDDASKQTEWQFYGRNGQSRAQALEQVHNNLRIASNHHTRAANSHSAAAAKLRTKAATVEHAGLDDETDDFLEHFGVKGMHWGVRRDGTRNASVPAGSSEDHQQAASIKAKVKQHGGIHALSTKELKTLNDRLNTEANYHRLNPQTGGLDKGRAFVKTVTGDVKTVLDAVETGRRVAKLAQSDQTSGPKHQSSRTRNAPLKVVSVS